MSCGVIGNTSDSGSEESRFETWQDNKKACIDLQAFFFLLLFMGITEHLVIKFDKGK